MVSITAPLPMPTGLTVKATGSAPRPSTLHKKRSSTTAGMGPDAVVEGSAKRLKVQFNQEVEVRMLEDFDKPLDLIREEVSRALQKHKLGDHIEYLQIKSAFEDGVKVQAPSEELPPRRKLLLALTGNASALSKSCGDLVSAVINSDWITEDPEYVETFARFLLILISANSSWMGESLEMLVQKFSKPSPDTSLPRTEAQRRIHLIIRTLLHKFPHSGPTSLRNIAENLYPASWDSTKAHVLYVHNLFKIIVYAPELEAAILSTVTGRLVKLDMQIQTDIEEIDDIDEVLIADTPGNLDNFMDSLEDEDEDLSDDDSDMGDDDPQTAEEKAKVVRKDIQRMDVLMDITFAHYEDTSGSTPEDEERMFILLESQFETYLLPSFRSRHTQFLLFRYAQKTPELIDRFVGTCLIKAMDQSKNTHVRQSAASYLASFVARGNQVSPQIVRDVFAYISDELKDLRQRYEANCRGPELSRYGTYYALVQALLYIFCFRWRDLETTPSDPGSPLSGYTSLMVHEEPARHTFVSGIKESLDQNILSPLNPLKVCSPVIVDEFAKVAHHVGILFIYPKIELNKRLRFVQTNASIMERETALTGRKDESMLQLDEYFPFDPYLLPRSKRWLEEDYRIFQGLPGDDGEETDSDEDEDEDEDDAGRSDSDDE